MLEIVVFRGALGTVRHSNHHPSGNAMHQADRNGTSASSDALASFGRVFLLRMLRAVYGAAGTGDLWLVSLAAARFLLIGCGNRRLMV